MSMSDCVKCWETPCVCGHDYKQWSTERITELIKVLNDVIKERYLVDTLDQPDSEG